MEKIITYSLTESFIENAAEFTEENFLSQGKDINRLAFVFGGRRPSLFLKRELARLIKKSYFPPAFFSIDEFIEYALSKKEPFLKISDLDACFILYKLTREIAWDILKGRESFSQFLPWAREILSFIEQLDLEDIEVESLKNIQFKATIGYDVPQNINALLGSIISLRSAYHAALKNKNTYSRGLIYLLASRYIRELDFSEFDQIFFCGFFYLHKTEQEIIKTLYDARKATLLFQGDEKDWTVLEKLSRIFSFPIKPQKERAPRYNLSIQAGFDAHSQVCLVREILKKIEELDKTVIVLPSPHNIIPLLSEIAGRIINFNVSMGYPLKRSSLYSLFECIFKAQSTKKGDEYYARDYLAVLSHPLVKNLKVLPNPSITRVLVHKIEEILLGIEKTALGGSLFFRLSDIQDSRDLYDLALGTMKTMDIQVSWEELGDATRELHNCLFILWENINNFYEFSLSLKGLLDTLVNKSFLGNYPLNLKMAQKMFSVADELTAASFNKEPFPKEDIFRIFENKLGAEMISFAGSPLKGLQILGLFETRSLSFENVIVMDINESVLPNLKIYEPLIPREAMISLGLNRLEREEEIQRYQFKRLISCAKNVYLIYQHRDDMEKSRFIEELIWERQKEHNALEVLSTPRAGFKVKVLPKRLEIKKNTQLIEFLKEYEYSASSINTYMHCPLKFYYQYVLGLREKEDLLEEPEGQDIGNFIHKLLYETFAKFIGRKPRINDEFNKGFFEALDKKFAEEFCKKMKSDSFLVREILIFRLERFLDNERKRDVREILCLEKTFRGRIKLQDGCLRFKAIVDRIDRHSDGGILILDYKTGGTDIMPQDTGKIESGGFGRESLKNTVRSFQLPLYLYLVDCDHNYKGKAINAALYAIKDLDKDFGLNKLLKKEEQLANKDKVMGVYLRALESILNDILNPVVPFRADEEDGRLCLGCPFFYLCR